jgi:hypothetical protein
MINRIRGLLILLGVLLPALACWSAPRVAADYARPTRTFKVCMLLLHGDTSPTGNPTAVPYWNSDPWFLPVMQHSPFKPAGWTMGNPLASAELPNDADLLNSGDKYKADPKGGLTPPMTSGSSWYLNGKAVGDRIGPDDPAYWAVKLDAKSLDALATFDLLIVDGHSQLILLNSERDALRYLLDRGATLWINNSQRKGNQLINFFLDPPLVFQRGPYDTKDLSSKLVIADPASWLLNGTYTLDASDVRFLRDNLSPNSYILSGVAGQAGSGNSLLQTVVSLFHKYPSGAYGYDPAIAAGRMGNGTVVVTAVDQMGATSDWWEVFHNYYDLDKNGNKFTITDLNVWPYTEGLGASLPKEVTLLPAPNIAPTPPQRPNRHFTYMASAKLFFNMLGRPQSWPMAGGNPLGTRALPTKFATSLTKSWNTGFSTLSDPVTLDNYVAVTGSSFVGQTKPGQLRVYRVRNAKDEQGIVLDYPYGLLDDNGKKVTTATLAPGTWAVGVPYNYNAIKLRGNTPYLCIASPTSDGVTPPENDVYQQQWRALPRDGVSSDAYTNSATSNPIPSEMELCFTVAAPADNTDAGCTDYQWVGSPVLARVTEPLPAKKSRTVLFGLLACIYQANANSPKYLYLQPRAYALDPFLTAVSLPPAGIYRQIADAMWRTAGYNAMTPGAGSNVLAVGPLTPTTTNAFFTKPHATLTFANNKLVVTAFGGVTTGTSSARVAIYDARNGRKCIETGGSPEWSANLRPTGAASLVTAQVEFDASDREMGIVPAATQRATYNVDQPQLRREMVELLAMTGEYYGADAMMLDGKSALFLAPPTLVARASATNQGIYFTSTAPPTDLRITDANGATINIGSPSSNFRQKYVLNIKTAGNALKITFRTWDIFVLPVVNNAPLVAPFTISFTPDRVSTAPASPVTVRNVPLTIGYPLELRGARRFLPVGRNWMTWDGEYGDTTSFGYGADVPPLIYRDQAVVGTNTTIVAGLPLLRSSANDAVMKEIELRQSGALTGTRLKIPALSTSWLPGQPITYDAEVAWQFHGNTQGPVQAPQAQSDFWYSNFPFPAAVSGDTVFTTAVYDGHGAYGGVGLYSPVAPTDSWYGMLYAVNPTTPRYLQQTVSAGLIANVGATANMLKLIVPETSPATPQYKPIAALRVGARALLKGFDKDPLGNALTPFTWDMGTITGVRKVRELDTTVMPNVWRDYYMISFNREYKESWKTANRRPSFPTSFNAPGLANGDWTDLAFNPKLTTNDPANPPYCWLMVTTSAPFVSHTRAWNAVTGSEAVRSYARNKVPAAAPKASMTLRLGSGVCTTPPEGDSANPDPALTPQEAMIALTGLEYTCHEPWEVDNYTVSVNKADTLVLRDKVKDDYLPDDWKVHDVTYLPQLPMSLEENQVAPNKAPELSYTVDARTGRILLSPRVAGEFADRFVVVHYFTEDLVSGTPVHPEKVHHAEVMYVPSPVRWEYSFTTDSDAVVVPDSGPTVVGDTLYVTAQRFNAILKRWEPVLYAFPTVPTDPLHVQPLWVQPLAVGVTANTPLDAPVPYRGATAPVPTPGGLLVGTALFAGTLPGVGLYNEFALFTDRGLLVGDGQRMLRANHDGQLTWEAAGTKDYDPAPLLNPSNNPVIALLQQTTGFTEQAFTLLTRVRRLPNGNVLVCDTGANRVVELNRDGTTQWQYPDSGLTYMDPDRDIDNNLTRREADLRALRLAEITPATLRLSGPRDVRRYYKDVAVDKVTWTNVNYSWVNFNLGPGTVRWEITDITDTGNNRILEVRRPLVRLDNVDALNQAFNLDLSPNFCYRPDLVAEVAGQTMALKQDSEVLVDGATLRTPEGLAFGKTISFTNALRYPGPDNTLQVTQTDAHPLKTGVRTRELLVSVGNPVSDPGNPGGFLRTLYLHVNEDPTKPANVGIFSTLEVGAAVGDGTAAKPLIVHYPGDFKVGDEVQLAYIDPTDPKGTRLIAFASTITAINPTTKAIALAQPLTTAFAAGTALATTKRWNALQIRPAPRLLLPVTLDKNLPLDRIVKLDYLCRLGVGDTIALKVPTTGELSPPCIITAVDTATNTVTLRLVDPTPLPATFTATYPAGTTIGEGSTQDYARIMQLDLVTLHSADYSQYQCNALVVDAAGVREVTCAPLTQKVPVFEMWQRTYKAAMSQTATWYADGGIVDKRFPPTADNTPTLVQALNTGDGDTANPLRLNFVTDLKAGSAIRLLYRDALGNLIPFNGKVLRVDYANRTVALEQPVDKPFPAGSWLVDITRKAKMLAWVGDDFFAPVAVLRQDTGNGQAGGVVDVRYLIAQMSTTVNADPATWPGGTPTRRVHLFEARWFDKAIGYLPGADNAAQWRIIDNEGNYYVYPDPVLPDYPNLPGWSYPLTQPLALDRD